ncbi:MAG TPA: hypothetical protein VFK07_01665 [Candidatus Paceibacterota bacterium]|nr:hypothetical protein [Candidatus Paceibacterota bacterium]
MNPFQFRRARIVFVAILLAVMTAACGKHGSPLSPDPSPTPTPGAAADAEVIVTWTPPAGTTCVASPQWSQDRAHFNTFHWPVGYSHTNQGGKGYDMKPHDVNQDGSRGYWTVTIKTKNSVQSDGTVEGWEFSIIDHCALDGSGAVADDNITVQVKGCAGDPVALPNMGGLNTAVYLVTPCGVGSTAQQAQARAQSGQ